MLVLLSLVVTSDVAVILPEVAMAIAVRLVSVVVSLVAVAVRLTALAVMLMAVPVRLVAVAVFGVASGGGAGCVADTRLPTIDPLKNVEWSFALSQLPSHRRTRFVRPPIPILQQKPV